MIFAVQLFEPIYDPNTRMMVGSNAMKADIVADAPIPIPMYFHNSDFRVLSSLSIVSIVAHCSPYVLIIHEMFVVDTAIFVVANVTFAEICDWDSTMFFMSLTMVVIVATDCTCVSINFLISASV